MITGSSIMFSRPWHWLSGFRCSRYTTYAGHATYAGCPGMLKTPGASATAGYGRHVRCIIVCTAPKTVDTPTTSGTSGCEGARGMTGVPSKPGFGHTV